MTIMSNSLIAGRSVFPSEIRSDKHETPQYLYNYLNEEFSFTLDPCAEPHTAKCELFYTEQDDGLSKDWSDKRVFVNPPYGKEIVKWLNKSISSAAELVVLLLPAYVESKWFQDIVLKYADEIRFCRGRLKFGEIEFIAPFASMIVIFRRAPLYGVGCVICKPLDLRLARETKVDFDLSLWEEILK